MANIQKTLALILGIVLAILGIWGLFLGNDGQILKIFGVNYFQSILHLVGGAFGIYAGTKGMGKGFNLTIGWIGIILGVLGFISGADTFLSASLNINASISWLHLVLGILSVIIGYAVKE